MKNTADEQWNTIDNDTRRTMNDEQWMTTATQWDKQRNTELHKSKTHNSGQKSALGWKMGCC